MQFNERGAVANGMPAATLDAKLAQIEKQLLEGRLADATVQLEDVVQSVPSASIVDKWLAAARARIITEQGVTLLQSHANVMHITSVMA